LTTIQGALQKQCRRTLEQLDGRIAEALQPLHQGRHRDVNIIDWIADQVLQLEVVAGNAFTTLSQTARNFLDELAEGEAQLITKQLLANMQKRSSSAQLDPELQQLVKKILKEGARNVLHGTALKRFERYGRAVHSLAAWFVVKGARKMIGGHVVRALRKCQRMAGARTARKQLGGSSTPSTTMAQAFASQLPSLVKAVVEDFEGDLRRRLDLCLVALRDSLSPSSSVMEHPCVASRVVRVACSGTILQSYLKATE
jgi:hypothetical protein